MTATVTGQLAAALRRRAEVARQRQREAIVLYDVVRLTSEPNIDYALQAVAERLRQELELAAVAIELTYEAGRTARASVGEDDALALMRGSTRPATKMLTSGPAPTAVQRGGPGRWIRVVPPRIPGIALGAANDRLHEIPVKAGNRRVGKVLLVRHANAAQFGRADDRLLSAVATQLGLAVERVRLQRKATEAEILRRAGELKSALLNAVSHDLRTPLASIVASAASLRQRDAAWTEDQRQDFAEAIEEEALRLNQIVGNLLDLSRIESGRLRPEKGWYDLSTLVDEVLGRLRPLTARHSISVSVADGLPPMHLDYVEIDQVLSNLAENATKYTRPGTVVEVSARRDDGEVQIAVADGGPGIPQQALPKLFEPFYRLDSKGPRPKGTGLGLAVAKGLVEAHGGRIWAENRPQGGARFIFTLPLPTSAEDTATGESPA